MVSGDAHMLAIDDGANSDYAAGGGAAFPVMHAAALDRTGSVKGGPYSHGTFPGPGQFGLMSVIDSGGSTITVKWSGRNSANAELVSHTFQVLAPRVPCDCAGQGDLQGDDGLLDILDVAGLINHAFRGAPPPVKDAACPHINRADLNCDAVIDILDVVGLIGTAFRAGPPPCDPCQCTPYPADCP
jgi:hypothetical protein